MSGTLNPSRLRHALVAAGAEPDLDLQDAITTAYEWHPGGGSATYAFASNGGNLADEAQRQQLLTEVEESIAWVTQNAAQIDAGKYPEYAEDAEIADEQELTTSQLQLKRLNNLKAVASQAVIVKEASMKEAAIENMPGEAEAHELELYAENTGSLYPQKLQIIKNLQRKMDKGIYDPNLAWRLWLYWIDEAAKSYAKEHGGIWYQMFPKTIRTQVAKSMSSDEEQRIREGEYREGPAPTQAPAAPVQASTDKEAKTLISTDVFRRAIAECNDLLGAVAGQGSDLEGKLTKIQHELNKLEVGAGGNLDFILDDEASPSTAKWARELIRALSTIKAQIPSAPAAAPAPVGVQGSVDKEAFGFTEQTARAILQFARTHKDQLAAMLNNRAQGPAAVLQALQKVPGGANMGGKLMPALQQWLTGAASDSAFAGMVEQLFTRKSATWDTQEAVHIASGALILAGFRPSEVSAQGSTVTVAGLKVNPHVLRHTAKLASDFGLQVKLQGGRRKKALAPPQQDPQQDPQQPGEAPVPPPPSAAGNHAGPANPTNPTSVDPAAQAQQVAPPPAAPAPVKTYGAPANNQTLPYGQKAGALVLAAGEQGDLHAAVESAYEWHGGQSSYLYSFASLGGVLYKESMRGGLENEVESAIQAVQQRPDAYDPDELDKLQNLLLVVSTVPAKHNDEEPEAVQASKQAADDSLVATLAEIESMLTAVQELADKSVGVARLSNNPTLVTNVERLNVKVYEGLLACRTAKADSQTSVKVPDSVAPAVGLTPVTAASPAVVPSVFTDTEAQEWLDAIKAQVQTPGAIAGRVSTLGGKERPSIMLVVAVDPADSWPNHILENSTYAKLSIDHTGTINVFSGGIRTNDGGYSRIKFRKSRVKDLPGAVAKMNTLVAYLTQAKGGPSLPDPTQPAPSRRKAAVEFLAKELEAGDIFSVPGQPMVFKALASAPSPNNPALILIQAETKTGEQTTLRVPGTSKLNLGSRAEFQAGTPVAVAASKFASDMCYGCGEAPSTKEVKGVPLCEGCYAEFTAGPEKGKCDYCGQPVPPELAEENVCQGCATMLSGASSFGEDEALGKPYDMVMASLVVAGEEEPITAGRKGKIHPKVRGYTDEGRAEAERWQAEEDRAAEEAKKPTDKKTAEVLDKGPDASHGDNVENAIEWINANGKDLDDKTVQQLRDALQAAGYTQQVADEAVTELLGQEALQALATPVKSLLGA